MKMHQVNLLFNLIYYNVETSSDISIILIFKLKTFKILSNILFSGDLQFSLIKLATTICKEIVQLQQQIV